MTGVFFQKVPHHSQRQHLIYFYVLYGWFEQSCGLWDWNLFLEVSHIKFMICDEFINLAVRKKISPTESWNVLHFDVFRKQLWRENTQFNLFCFSNQCYLWNYSETQEIKCVCPLFTSSAKIIHIHLAITTYGHNWVVKSKLVVH